MTHKDDYKCPRCGYCTRQKSHMKKHLYNLLKPCPSLLEDIELTDEIREYILKNRVYKTKDTKAVVQTINNYNQFIQISNIINSMDTIDKINFVCDYKGENLLDFEDKLEERFTKVSEKLEQNQLYEHYLKNPDLLEVIDDITTSDNPNNVNIVYDSISNKIKIYQYGEWKSYIIDRAIIEIIDKIRVYYLDYYECYLIRKYQNARMNNEHKQLMIIKEYIIEYYKFLLVFDVLPYIHDKNNFEILYPTSDTQNIKKASNDIECCSIQDEFMKLFKCIKDEVTVTTKAKLKKDIENLIKNNVRSNLSKLNRNMIEFIKMDEEFKKELLNNLKFIFKT